MFLLSLLAYLAWTAAAILGFFALEAEEVFYVFAALSCAISGVLFFAFSRGLYLLKDMRDAIVVKSPENFVDEEEINANASEEAWRRI